MGIKSYQMNTKFFVAEYAIKIKICRLILVKCIFYYKIFNNIVYENFYYFMFCMLNRPKTENIN